MKSYWITVLLPLAALCAAAQGNPEETKVKLQQFIATSKMIGPEGMVLNGAVKGAPYAADEVTQFTQTLGDGTHIQRESKVAVYRDGQGRVRRETPSEITITDPVTGASYSLDPKTMTGRKMFVMVFAHTDGPVSTMEVVVNGAGPLGAERKAKLSEERSVVVTGRAKAVAVAPGQGGAVFAPRRTGSATDGTLDFIINTDTQAGGESQTAYKTVNLNVNFGDPIGQQVVEGVLCDGTRNTETIAAGAIGNDRLIQTVNERWYSPELQTTVRTVRTDPRTGDESFRLTNIRRGEPSPDLFQVPTGYQIVGN